MNAKRVDPNTGQEVPAIGDKPEYTDVVRSIRTTAARALAAASEKAYKQDASKEAVQALNDGSPAWWSIRDKVNVNPVSGETMSVTAEQQRKLALGVWQDNLDNLERRSGITPGARFKIEYEKLAPLGETNPRWSQVLNGAVTGLANEQQLSNPGQARNLTSAALLYEQLYNLNPAYAEKHLEGSASKDFFSAYVLAKNSLGMSQEQAAQMAAKALRSNIDPRLEQSNYQAIKSEAGKADGAPFRILGAFYGEPQNRYALQTEIERGARLLMRAGEMSPEKAVEAASKMVRDRVTNVRGRAVWDDPHISKDNAKDAVPAVDAIINRFYKQNETLFKERGLNPSDISFRQIGSSGMYQFVGAKDGLPIPIPMRDEKGNVRYVNPNFALADLKNEQAMQAKAKRDAAIQKAAEAQAAAREKAILDAGPRSVRGATVDTTPDNVKQEAARIRAKAAEQAGSSGPETLPFGNVTPREEKPQQPRRVGRGVIPPNRN